MTPDTAASVVARLITMFRAHNPTGLGDLLAEDCVLYTTGPAPAGGTVAGAGACEAHWTRIILNTVGTFEVEEEYLAGGSVIQQWRFVDTASGELLQRGVNLFRVKDGRIYEAHGYVKAGE